MKKFNFHPIRKIKQYWKNVKQQRKENEQNEKIREINDRFYLMENAGKIYIICSSTAVYEAPNTEQAHQIVEKLEQMRRTTYIYKCSKNK